MIYYSCEIKREGLVIPLLKASKHGEAAWDSHLSPERFQVTKISGGCCCMKFTETNHLSALVNVNVLT